MSFLPDDVAESGTAVFRWSALASAFHYMCEKRTFDITELAREMELPIRDLPQDCGRRIIPQLIDNIARFDPTRIFISIPRSSRVAEGFVDVTYREFARSVNRCCTWIQEHVGDDDLGRTIAYYGPLDIRYLIFLLGAAKTGHVAFLSSHRNSVEAHLKLLEATECQVVVVAEGAPAVIGEILDSKPLTKWHMPNLEYFLNDNEYHLTHEWTEPFEDVKNRALVILHTSGSTGIPKPVYVTHGTFAGNDSYQLIPSHGGKPTFFDHLHGRRIFVALPVFHAANLSLTLGFSAFLGVICVLPPPGPVTAETVDRIHTHGRLHASLMPPSLLIDIHDQERLFSNMVDKLSVVAYCGGTLPKKIGDEIAARMKLVTLFGSTEMNFLPIEMREGREDWEYMSISPCLGHVFKPKGGNLKELIIVRQEHLRPFQGVFYTFPGIDEYSMGDLYEQHPTHENLWVCRGRTDDVIAFNTAEKLNPVTMEATLCEHPAINSAVIAGEGRFQAALLVEPKQALQKEEDKQTFINDIWPKVVEANGSCPAHGRVMKDCIITADPKKPFPRAGKDTTQRFAALKTYSNELEDLYNRMDQSRKGARAKSPMSPALSSAPSTETSLTSVNNSSESLLQSSSNGGSDLDSKIEAIIDRLLPSLLAKHLRPALIDILATSSAKPQVVSEAAAIDKEMGLDSSRVPDLHHLNPSEIASPRTDFKQEVRQAVRDAIGSTTYLYQYNDESNLFQCGLDSLQVVSMVGEINTNVGKSTEHTREMSTKDVYDNPTVEGMIRVILKGSSSDDNGGRQVEVH